MPGCVIKQKKQKEINSKARFMLARKDKIRRIGTAACRTKPDGFNVIRPAL